MKYSIKKSKSNKSKWELSFSHYDSSIGKNFRMRKSYGTKEEAEEKLLELMKCVNEKDYVLLENLIRKKNTSVISSSPLLISDLYQKYLIEAVVNIDVRRDRQTVWNKYLSVFYGSKTINEIDRNLMSSLRQELPKMKTPKGNQRKVPYEDREVFELSEYRQSTVWKDNRAFINWAETAGFIPEGNYFKGIKGFSKKKVSVPKSWNIEEFNKFISVVDNDKEKSIFITLYWCGFRISELLGLRFKNIDFDNNIIHIEKQLYKGQYKNTKNNKDRSVNMPEVVKNYLLDYKQHYLNMGISENKVLDCYCFVNDKGNPYPKTTLERNYKNYIEKAGVKYLSLHGLRHSFCTNLISEFNCSPRYVAEQSGDTIETIMAHYVGTTKSDTEKAVEGINKYCKY